MEHPMEQFYRTFGLTYQPKRPEINLIILMNRWSQKALMVDHDTRRNPLMETLEICEVPLNSLATTGGEYHTLHVRLVGIGRYQLCLPTIGDSVAAPSWTALAELLLSIKDNPLPPYLRTLMAQVAGRAEFRGFYTVKK